MRRLFIAATVASIACALMHCSQTTELVVAVDTDLVPGSEVDLIDVAVDGPTGPVFDGDAGVFSASALPLTLGVAAGSSDDAEVHIIATAFKNGVAVARTEVVARFVPGESRLVQVSICKSCGLTCGKNLGSSLPEWNDTLPSTNACTTTFADAGNFDSGRPPDDATASDGAGNDAPSTTDAPTDSPVADAPFDANVCGSGCPSGTACDTQGCRITGEPTCASSVIEVPTDGRAFYGKICATNPGAKVCGASATTYKAHVYHFTGSGQYTVTFKGISTQVKTSIVDSSCVATGGCNATGMGTPNTATVSGGQYFGIGVDIASGCSDYTLSAFPK